MRRFSLSLFALTLLLPLCQPARACPTVGLAAPVAGYNQFAFSQQFSAGPSYGVGFAAPAFGGCPTVGLAAPAYGFGAVRPVGFGVGFRAGFGLRRAFVPRRGFVAVGF